MATEVSFIDESLTESTVDGMLQYDLNRTYQVLFDAGATGGPVSALEALDSYGISIGRSLAIPRTTGVVIIWCNRRTPRRENVEASRRKWLVDCTFTSATNKFERNDQGEPAQTPQEIVKEVDISFYEDQEAIDDAAFLGVYRGGNSTQIAPTAFVGMNTFWMPIMCSNGMPVERTRPVARKTIRISKYYRDWNNGWDSYLYTINNDTVVVTQEDSADPPERLRITFNPKTLLMSDIVKQDVWRDGFLWFKVSFVMQYNKLTWIHRELDQGRTLYAYEGQLKDKSGGQYSQQDIENLKDNPHQPIKTGKDVDIISDPLPLNGDGAPMDWDETALSPSYMYYSIYEEKAFNSLGIFNAGSA